MRERQARRGVSSTRAGRGLPCPYSAPDVRQLPPSSCLPAAGLWQLVAAQLSCAPLRLQLDGSARQTSKEQAAGDGGEQKT
jgi:hypothetical protein